MPAENGPTRGRHARDVTTDRHRDYSPDRRRCAAADTGPGAFLIFVRRTVAPWRIPTAGKGSALFSQTSVTFILLLGIVLMVLAARGAMVVGRQDDARNQKIDDDLNAA
jgi:hypothetical protein